MSVMESKGSAYVWIVGYMGHLLQDVGGIRARELVDRACTTINNCCLLYIHDRAYDVLNWRETVPSNQQSIS